MAAAAASTAISSVGCQMILRAPRPSSSTSFQPISCVTDGEHHNSVSPKGLPGLSLPARHRSPYQSKRLVLYKRRTGEGAGVRRSVLASVAAEDLDTMPARSGDSEDQQEGLTVVVGKENGVAGAGNHAEVFASEGGDVEDVDMGFSPSASSSSGGEEPKGQHVEQMVDRAINATIVLAAGTAVVTKLLTIDHDYWHEIL